MKRTSLSVSCLVGALLLGALPAHHARADALSLDGVDDWVSFVGTGVPVGNAPFTIGAWINPTSIPGGGENGGTMTFWGDQSGNEANGFRLRGAAGTRHYFWGNDHDENFGIDILPDNTGPFGNGWHHLAITWDGTQTNWYWNGNPLGNPRNAVGVNVAAANYRIGSRLNAEFFHGLIDEVSIWNVPLDAPTIAAGFTQGIDAGNPAVSPFLVAYWNFENGLVDVAGGDNNGTANGGALVAAGVNAPITVIPEPSSIVLVVLGGLMLLFSRQWRLRRVLAPAREQTS